MAGAGGRAQSYEIPRTWSRDSLVPLFPPFLHLPRTMALKTMLRVIFRSDIEGRARAAKAGLSLCEVVLNNLGTHVLYSTYFTQHARVLEE